MEDLNSIEALLEKYYRGETSTAEEGMLREFFAAGDVPEHLAADAELFGFFRIQQEGGLPGDLQNRLEGMIDESSYPGLVGLVSGFPDQKEAIAPGHRRYF